jgi:hypothetical protein
LLGWGKSELQRVRRLCRASVGVVDQATTTERKQGLVGGSNAVAGLLTLLATLLGRACNDGLELGLAGHGSDRVEYVVGLASGICLDGRSDLGSDKLVCVDVVTLCYSCPGSSVGSLFTTELGLNLSSDCRTDCGGHRSLSKCAGLCGSSDSGINGLLNQDTLQAVNSVSKLLDILDVLDVSCTQVSGTAQAGRNA